MRGRSLSLFPCQSPADVFLAVMFYCSREETRIFFFFSLLYGYKGLWHTLDFISSLILEGNVFNYKTKKIIIKNTGDLAKPLVVFKVI